MTMHCIGIGDYTMTSITALPDPLPLPDKESERKVSKNECLGLTLSEIDFVLLFKLESYR